MADARKRRGPKAIENDGLGQEWAEAVASGADPAGLAARIVEHPPQEAASGVRALGRMTRQSAVPLLSLLANSAESEVAQAAVEALGSVRDLTAASALDAVARATQDKQLQKAARRSLYRLSSQGIRVAAPETTAPATVGSRAASIYRVIASAYDGSGTRSIWFAADRRLGGIFQLAVATNDTKGMIDFAVRDTTRKRFSEQEATMRDKDIAAW